MKLIIHDWPDEQAVAILRIVRAAAGGDATVLLLETVLPDHDRDFPGKWVDLAMCCSSEAAANAPQPNTATCSDEPDCG